MSAWTCTLRIYHNIPCVQVFHLLWYVSEYHFLQFASSLFGCFRFGKPAIRAFLTSCSSLLLQISPPARPPRVSVITFTSYICYIYTLKLGQYRTLFCLANSSISKCLICSFCSSDRGFARRSTFKPPHPTSFRLRLTADALVFG